jgi:hypothetical protein
MVLAANVIKKYNRFWWILLTQNPGVRNALFITDKEYAPDAF